MKQAAMKIIAHIRSDFPTKFGIPRQSGLVEDLTAQIVFTPEYRVPEAVRWAGGFLPHMAHLAVLKGRPGGLVPNGAPTTSGWKHPYGCLRHPFPLPSQRLGLSCVKLLSVEPSTPEGPGAYSGRC